MVDLFSKSEHASLKAPSRKGADGGPRILAYCASNIGMGHFGRISRVLRRVREKLPESSILMASDIRPKTQALCSDLALLRLPGFVFDRGGQFGEHPEFLSVDSKSLQLLRSNVLLSAAVSFQPDVVVMDTNPHGKRDEMLPLLRHLRSSSRPCRVILILRDVPCPPGEKFKLNGSARDIEKHAALYDRFLISGDANYFNVEEAYGWSERLRRKTRYTGFIVPPKTELSRREAFEPFAGLDPEKKTVVASFGGGWEAGRIAPLLLEALNAYRAKGAYDDLQMALFTGPATSEADDARLRRLAANTSGVVLRTFSASFPALLSHCDMAILLAGSTVFQILESDLPVLLYSRDYKSSEQAARAQLLEGLPGVHLLDSAKIEASRLEEDLRWGLEGERAARSTGFSFDGVEAAADEIIQAARTII